MKLKLNEKPNYENVTLNPKKKDAMMCWVTAPEPLNITVEDEETTQPVQMVAIPPQI